MTKTTFRLVSSVFWAVFISLIIADTVTSKVHVVEPPAIAWGSGQAASGGHCSGR